MQEALLPYPGEFVGLELPAIQPEDVRQIGRAAQLLAKFGITASLLTGSISPVVAETSEDYTYVTPTQEAAAVLHEARISGVATGAVGMGALWLYTSDMDIGDIFGMNFNDLFGGLEQEPDSIEGEVANTQAHEVMMTVPLTISSDLEVEVRMKEDGFFFGWGPALATQVADTCVQGDSDIAISGVIEARRINANTIEMIMDSPTPWRTRILPETIDHECNGKDIMTGFWGSPERRDETTTAALVIASVMMEAETCEQAANVALEDEILGPIVERILTPAGQSSGGPFSDINYDSTRDTVEVTFRRPGEDSRLVTSSDYTEFLRDFDMPNGQSSFRPRMDNTQTMETIRQINESVDSLKITLSGGEQISGDELLERGYVCQPYQDTGQAVIIEANISGDVDIDANPGSVLDD